MVKATYSVANKFVLLVAPPILLLTILLGIAMGTYENLQQANRLEILHQERSKQLISILTEPLSFFEYRLVETIAQTAMNSDYIEYIHIRNPLERTIVELGLKKSSTLLSKIESLDTSNTKITVGSIELGFDDISEKDSYLNIYKIPFTLSALSSFLLVVFLYLAWNHVIAAPLDDLRNAMESSDGGSEQKATIKTGDEFGQIANAYNNMIERVIQHRSQIEERDALFQMLYNRTPALMLSCNQEGKIIRVSNYLCDHLGYTEKELLGTFFNNLVNTNTSINNNDRSPLELTKLNHHPLQVKHAQGDILQCTLNFVPEPNNSSSYLGVLNDITEEYKSNLKLEQLANYDQLTGLLNSSAFSQKVASITHSTPIESYWFLFIDLDRFKWINDSYGHFYGDEVLKEVAIRLQQALPNSMLSRFGGDEFVAFIKAENHDISSLFRHIKHYTNQRMTLSIAELTPSVCIGAAKFPDDGIEYEDLLQKADTAMYRAKILGRNTDFIYNNFLDDLSKRQTKVVDILQKFIIEDNIDVYFQPIIDTRTNKIVSAEALMRITSVRNSDLPISLFLQIAEESGYIRRIDRLARHKAMGYLAQWRARGIPIEDIHINVSPLNFNSEDFLDDIQQDLRTFQLGGHSIILEITESVLIENPTNAIQQLNRIKNLGVRIALDDFGTGYSSLSMLTNFPVDILKLDQSFFLGENAENKKLIISHLIAMARSLKIDVIAEGIESTSTAQWLADIKCHFIQGFLFSQPLTAYEFERFFISNLQNPKVLGEKAPPLLS